MKLDFEGASQAFKDRNLKGIAGYMAGLTGFMLAIPLLLGIIATILGLFSPSSSRIIVVAAAICIWGVLLIALSEAGLLINMMIKDSSVDKTGCFFGILSSVMVVFTCILNRAHTAGLLQFLFGIGAMIIGFDLLIKVWIDGLELSGSPNFFHDIELIKGSINAGKVKKNNESVVESGVRNKNRKTQEIDVIPVDVQPETQVEPVYETTFEQTDQPSDTLSIQDQIRYVQKADEVIKRAFELVNNSDSNRKRIANYKSSLPIVLPIIIIIFGSLPLYMLYSAYRYFLVGSISTALQTFLVGLILLLIVAGIIALVVKNEKKIKNRHVQLMLQAEQDEQYAEDLMKQNARAVAFIPRNYRFPLATSYIRELFETGRVKNMNEALDKYDEYEHRLKMEMAQSEIYAQLQAQQKMIINTNAAATVSAAASVMNLLLHL